MEVYSYEFSVVKSEILPKHNDAFSGPVILEISGG